MPTRRDILRTAVAGATLVAAPRIVTAATRTKQLRYIPQADLSVLDPLWTTAYVTLVHGYAVYDTLYGMDASYNVQPQMVAGHLIEDDGKRWTLTLREGLAFHDGEPVRGRDVVASIRRWGAKDVFGRELMAVTDELAAPDDRSVVFRLKRPFPMLPAALGKAGSNMPCIMPERLAATDPKTQIKEVVGSGPFRFLADEWVSGSRVVYEKFGRYRPREDGVTSYTAGPKIAHLDRVEWSVIPEPATAVAAMMAGEADWWDNASTDLLELLVSDPSLAVVPSTIPLASFMRFNTLHPPFDNAAVRRALLGAVDQRAFLAAASGTDESHWNAGVGFFNSVSPMATTACLEALTGPRDLDKVRRDLDAAGYDGAPVVLLDPVDIPGTHGTALVGADLFAKVGMNVDVQSIDWGTLLQRRASMEAPEKGGWSVFFSGLSNLNGFDPVSNFALRGNGKEGWFGWLESPALEECRQAWLEAPDLAAQKAAAERMQLQAFQDVPHIPLGEYHYFHAYRNNLANFPAQFALFYNVDLA